jgi:hypothetical protein
MMTLSVCAACSKSECSLLQRNSLVLIEFYSLTVKADSYIACRTHAVPLPCRAAKGLEGVFPI